MTTHLELARIQLNSSGIPQGATQGVGTIIELETPYNGNANPVDVHLVYPASQAIPGQTIVSCYFQSDEGWYIVQGEPGPAGSGQTPWIRFRVKNPVGYQRSGTWNVIVTQVRNGDGTTVSVGDEVEVNDVSNLFADVVFSAYQSVTRCEPEDFLGGSTGTAYLRTPATSNNIPDEVTRWEVETCSRSIDRIEAKLVDCMRAYNPNGDTFTGQAYLDTNMPWWNLSAYPAVDFPPEILDNDISEIPYCWKIDYENPLALTAKNESTVILRRHTNKLPSMPTNADMPHDNGVVGNSEKWYVEQVYEKRSGDRGSFARYITVTKGGTWNNYSLVSYWDGQSPITPVDDVCEPGIVCLFDCACVEDGDTLFGIYNEVSHEYQLIATASAMLGPPQDLDVFTDASSAPCGFNFLKQPTKAFTCGEPPVVQPETIATVTQTVFGNAYRYGNDICFDRYNIEVCSATPLDPDLCVNLCAQCDCDEHICAFQYTQGEGWAQVKTCPADYEDCCCTGEMPTTTPSGTDPTYVTYPCGPCPSDCVTCDSCLDDCPGGYEFTIDDISGVLTNGDRIEFVLGTDVWTSSENECCKNLSIQMINQTSGQTQTVTAEVCLINPSNIPNCAQNNRAALSLTWSVPVVLGMTMPTEIGADVPNTCEATYGNNQGCGILPDFPDLGGGSTWDNVTFNATCCVVEGGSRDIALESMGVHDVGAGFHNASLNAPPRTPPASTKATAKPQGWGDAFVKENPELFKGCGCKKDIVPVMNRWERREGEPSDDSVLLVATTLYGKQKRGIQSRISVESLSNDIREFTNRMRTNG